MEESQFQQAGSVTMRTTAARMGVRGPRAKEWNISPDPEYARKKAWRDRQIRLDQWHPDWLLGFADEVWPRRLAHPALHAGQDNDTALRLIEQTVARDDSAPEAQAQRIHFTHVRHYASPRPPLRLRRMTTAAVVAAVVLLLCFLAAVTAHVLTTPAHNLAVLPSIASQLTILSPTSVPAIGWSSVIAVVVLLILLVEKQRVAGASGGRETKLSRALNIAILPLLAALAVTVLVEVAASVSQGS
jgi:hypothetical protein